MDRAELQISILGKKEEREKEKGIEEKREERCGSVPLWTLHPLMPASAVAKKEGKREENEIGEWERKTREENERERKMREGKREEEREERKRGNVEELLVIAKLEFLKLLITATSVKGSLTGAFFMSWSAGPLPSSLCNNG
jgi:hypothetical protein